MAAREFLSGITPRAFEDLNLYGERATHHRHKAPPNRLLASDTTHRESVVPVVVILRVDCRCVNVQVVHIVAIVVGRRPPVAPITLIVRRAIVVVARQRGR